MVIINLGRQYNGNIQLRLDDWAYALLRKLRKKGTRFRRIKSRNKYYAEFTACDNRKYLIHRFLMNQHTKDFVIDHRDGNGTNNVYSNLRRLSYADNMMNRRAFAGVKTTTKLHHIVKAPKSFYVRIVKNGKEYAKGGFKTIEDAIAYHKQILPKLYPLTYKTIFEENGYVAKT